jgi:hypothetical protein
VTTTRRRLLAVLAAGVLSLAACTGGGGGDDAAIDDEGITGPPPTQAPPTTTPTDDAETFEFISQKNPFTPLAGPTAGGTTGGGTTGTTAPTGGTGTGGTGTGTTGTGGTGTGTTGGTGDVEPQVAQRIALLDVFSEGGQTKANVRVNSTVHEVAVGETFAGRYKVLSLSQSEECGRFLFGDDAFRLCRGEQAVK